MTHRDKVSGALRSLNAGEARHLQWIALGIPGKGLEHCIGEHHKGAGSCFAAGRGFRAHVDHVRVAFVIVVGKLVHVVASVVRRKETSMPTARIPPFAKDVKGWGTHSFDLRQEKQEIVVGFRALVSLKGTTLRPYPSISRLKRVTKLVQPSTQQYGNRLTGVGRSPRSAGSTTKQLDRLVAARSPDPCHATNSTVGSSDPLLSVAGTKRVRPPLWGTPPGETGQRKARPPVGLARRSPPAKAQQTTET